MIAALQAPSETKAALAASRDAAEKVRTGIPDAGWTREELDRRADWEVAKLKRRKHYAAVYWWLGKVLACVRRSLNDGVWTAWREEHHIDRTKAQRALFFARVFDSLDTAAVLANLDLLVSCDTSLAHLAGALRRPVWVAVAFSPDWRWMLGREDSPWYPSLRLFRQRRPGDWVDVVERLAEALAILRNERSGGTMG